MFPKGVVLIDGGRKYTQQKQVTLSADYPDAFYSYVASAGRNMSAALYEGSESAGGYAVPVTVDDQSFLWPRTRWPYAVLLRSFRRLWI